jgi:hypothetical protein
MKGNGVKLVNLLTAGALVTSLVSPQVMADITKNSTLSSAQKKDIEKIVHDYLVNNPEVLLEAS